MKKRLKLEGKGNDEKIMKEKNLVGATLEQEM